MRESSSTAAMCEMAPTAAITKERLSRHLVRLSLFPIFFLLFFFLSPATLWVGLIRTAGQQTDKQKGVRESVAVCVVVWNKETRERITRKTKVFCCWFGRRDRVGVPPTHTHTQQKKKKKRKLLFCCTVGSSWHHDYWVVRRFFFSFGVCFSRWPPRSTNFVQKVFSSFFFFFFCLFIVFCYFLFCLNSLANKAKKKKNIKKWRVSFFYIFICDRMKWTRRPPPSRQKKETGAI